MRLARLSFWAIAMAAGLASAAQAADYAGHRYRHHMLRGYIGECVRTRVEAVAAPIPGGAPAIVFRDGVMQAYDAGMLGQSETVPGDPIQLCLVSFTRDCGGFLGRDLQPGRTYATGNLRTGAAWTSPDIRSSCARR